MGTRPEYYRVKFESLHPFHFQRIAQAGTDPTNDKLDGNTG